MSNQSPEHEGLPTAGVDDVQADPADSPLTAIEKARAIIAGHADNAQAKRLLAAALRRLGRHDEAAREDVEANQASARAKPLVEAPSAKSEIGRAHGCTTGTKGKKECRQR